MKWLGRAAAGTVGALGALGWAGTVLASAPAADAAQTSTWGIVAAPNASGFRSYITDPADGATIHDAVIVFNRTGQPITVNLNILGASYRGGAYQFSNPATGLAAGVALAAPAVTLGPHQQARVPVTIHEPRGVKSTLLAGVAAEAAPVQDGALSIQQRLVVLVAATPTHRLLPVAPPEVAGWGAAAAVILGLVMVGAVVQRRRGSSRNAPSRLPTPRATGPAPAATGAG